MDQNSSSTSQSSRVDPRRGRIHRRLQLVGPGPAAFYDDACRLMQGEIQLASTSHLVSHLLREVEGALRDALEPMMAPSASLDSGKEPSRATDKPTTHKQEILAVLGGLAIGETEPVALAWLALAGARNEYGLSTRAHRERLDPPRPSDTAFQEFFRQFEEILDEVLERVEARFSAYLNLVDAVLAGAGTPSTKIEKFHPDRFPNNFSAYEYLFGKLGDAQDSAWLEPLRTNGFFRHPPEAIHTLGEDGTTVTYRFVPWPQSWYLARMARADQNADLIVQIAGEIPETDNIRVHRDLVEVALALPPHLAARLAPSVGNWATAPLAGFLPLEAAALVGHLARGGEVNAALDLTRTLLAIKGGETPPPLDLAGEVLEFDPTPRSSFDDSMYQYVADELRHELFMAAGTRALDLTCDLLEDAIAQSFRPERARPPEDYSDIWWPAIESTDDVRLAVAGIRGTLVTAIRDGAGYLAASRPPLSIAEVLSVLATRQWRIFRRLELHLLRTVDGVDADLVIDRLTNPAHNGAEPAPREYTRCLQDHFAGLPGRSQLAFLDMVQRGPDLEALITRIQEQTGRPSSDNEIEVAVGLWQWHRVAPLKNVLPSRWRPLCEDLIAQFGDSNVPDIEDADEVWIGPTSPLTSAQLRETDVDQIAAALSDWTPLGDFRSPTPEGLGRVLAAVVEEAPARFAAGAEHFKGLDPTYVRALLHGHRQAVQTKTSITWEPVLALCQWVVEQPREIDGRERSDLDVDPSWAWARREISRLLAYGLVEGPSAVPFDLRSQIWCALAPLADDPDPTPDDEAQYGGADTDPLDFGLNTVRPSALMAILQYVLWVRANVGTDRWRGLDDAPEAREVLESRLSPSVEPSPTVRVVFGQWLPWLIRFDAHWVQAHLGELFPDDPALAHLRSGVWEAYLVANRPDRTTFGLLHGEYRRATSYLDTEVPLWTWRKHSSPPEALGEHLVTLLAWGLIGLDDPDGLLENFYRRAPVEVRAHVLDWIGRELSRSLILLQSAELDRLKDLWKWRLVQAEATGLLEAYAEMKPFGWWFISGRFDEDWGFEQLRRVLQLIGSVDPARPVVKRMSQLATIRPDIAIECLAMMLDGSDAGSRLAFARADDIRALLLAASEHGNERAKQTAREIANRLVARGMMDFNDVA